ncbi:ArsR family transcriptional regulator [Actinomadura sp. WMMA1423]|uniref:arsenate reductase/protein-tyrosine-phosphatase family protein n=1 Tax=Actinomadura sp. WMMA1423 TaxID=2591108 RepID=UPI001F0CFF2D|nr:ArsR family transcriptional regulator [Actinomadura sp. WMMA1423]
MVSPSQATDGPGEPGHSAAGHGAEGHGAAGHGHGAADRAGTVPDVPQFVRLAAHPLRWGLLTALAGGDLRVRELMARVDASQNLVSYHLRLLRQGGLVTATRSTFDGRDTYYRLDLDRCAHSLAAAGPALHPAPSPALDPALSPALDPALSTYGRQSPGHGVLFVCTGNSARSPIAEALLRHRSAGRVTATSAGTRPKTALHPRAVEVLRERYGIDIADQRPRHLDTVRDHRFDHVITLCDRAREACPEFGDRTRRIHWSTPDPATAATAGPSGPAGAGREIEAEADAFIRAAADIDTRVRYLLPVLSLASEAHP